MEKEKLHRGKRRKGNVCTDSFRVEESFRPSLPSLAWRTNQPTKPASQPASHKCARFHLGAKHLGMRTRKRPANSLGAEINTMQSLHRLAGCATERLAFLLKPETFYASSSASRISVDMRVNLKIRTRVCVFMEKEEEGKGNMYRMKKERES